MALTIPKRSARTVQKQAAKKPAAKAKPAEKARKKAAPLPPPMPKLKSKPAEKPAAKRSELPAKAHAQLYGAKVSTAETLRLSSKKEWPVQAIIQEMVLEEPRISRVNIASKDLKLRMEYHSHVALEYNRGTKWSEFIYFDPSGPRKERLLTSTFERDYYRVSEVEAGRAALSFLQAHKRAFIPDAGVFEIIMEVYITSKTEGKKDLSTLSAGELVVVYNELAEAVGKQAIKTPYKGSKKDLLTRIEALRAEAAQPTPQQEAAAASNAAKAEDRLAGLNDLKAEKAAAKAAKTSTTKENTMATAKKATPKKTAPAAKKAAPKKAAPAAKKATTAKKAAAPKKQGIGAYCTELIRNGKTNEEVLAAVKRKFPDANTSAASVSWYRNKLKDE
ncbi:MAG: hypothetical protein WC736_15750 [Gallionella sp.]|jgi:hypothetical protein